MGLNGGGIVHYSIYVGYLHRYVIVGLFNLDQEQLELISQDGKVT